MKFEAGRRYFVTFSDSKQKAALLSQLPPPPQTAQVTADGGLISNLKVLDNILLPATYHYKRSMAELERQIVGLLSECGMTEAEIRTFAGKSPAHLSLLERRLAGFVRAVLLEPGTMVYDSLWDDLSKHEEALVLKFDDLFRARYPEAMSIYLHNGRHPRPDVSVDQTIDCDQYQEEAR